MKFTIPARSAGMFVRLAAMAAVLLALMPATVTAEPVLRVTAIPDEAPTELQRKFKPLGAYLSNALGMKVEFTPVTDYAASVEALVGNKVDLAWFGGFTFIQAKVRSNGQVVPLAQRAEDQQFQSVFVTADPAIRTLQDLKGKTFAFGSESSTSGHLMPRHFLLAASVNPDRDFRRVAYSGAHDATAAAVAGGKVDAGALNRSVWDKLVAEGRVDSKAVRVFYTTPGYADYNWTARADLAPELRRKLTDAFLALDPGKPAHQEILALQRASRFVPTQTSNYDAIEAAARSAGLLK